MTKVYTIENVDFKIPIIKNKEIILTEDENMYSITPYRIHREGLKTYLVYNVTNIGKTLRQFITELNMQKPKRSFRQSFRKHFVLNPVDILIQLIDACDYLLTNNKILSQSHINPDLIWIEQDCNNKITVKLIDTLDFGIMSNMSDIYLMEIMYLSPELLGKRNHMAYYADENSYTNKQYNLKRYDTRPSTISSVYSLGLVMYFMIMNQDPYIEPRIHVDERPNLGHMNPDYSKLIYIATNPDPKHRPTLKEFRELIIDMKTPKSICYL
jgi:serine/threonine protein kinase